MYMVKQPQERRLQRETEGNMIEEKMASGQGKKHSFWSPSNVVPVSSCQVCDVYTPPHRPIFHNSLPTSHLAQIINNSSFPTICSWRQWLRNSTFLFALSSEGLHTNDLYGWCFYIYKPKMKIIYSSNRAHIGAQNEKRPKNGRFLVLFRWLPMQ